MKAMVFGLSVLASLGLLAGDGEIPAAHVRGAQKKFDPVAHSNMLVRTGGFVDFPGAGPLPVFLNAQSRVPRSIFEFQAEEIYYLLRLKVDIREVKNCQDAVALARQALSDTNIASAVVVCDQPGIPALLTAPEERWAIVNVKALDAGCDTPLRLNLRAKKELMRGFAYSIGGGSSALPGCIMNPVFKLDDLDRILGTTLSPDPLSRIMHSFQKLGITIPKRITYLRACQKGIAPMPTNALQKAVWECVKKQGK